MLKAKCKIDGKKVWIFGLDAENIRRLKNDSPIKISSEEIMTDYDIYLVYGDTIAEIATKLNNPTTN